MTNTPASPVSKFSLTPHERETIVNATDGDEVVRVWTAQRKHITKLRRNDAFTETASGYHGGTEWAEFAIPATDWNPASGAKRKRAPLTEEQRQALADRLAKSREERA